MVPRFSALCLAGLPRASQDLVRRQIKVKARRSWTRGKAPRACASPLGQVRGWGRRGRASGGAGARGWVGQSGTPGGDKGAGALKAGRRGASVPGRTRWGGGAESAPVTPGEPGLGCQIDLTHSHKTRQLSSPCGIGLVPALPPQSLHPHTDPPTMRLLGEAQLQGVWSAVASALSSFRVCLRSFPLGHPSWGSVYLVTEQGGGTRA